jgi:serine/threonine-protein kinase
MPWSGRTLGGRYTLGALLGKGGMGAVYAATQNDLGRRVAVKVLHPHLAERPDLLTRFKREAMAAAALGHTNIVQVTDFCQLPGEPAFLVMEQLDGETLRDCMHREGPMPGDRVAFIAAQMLAALDAAHRAGIIHRDLKPENVFLTAITGVRDIVKVLDFGLAKHAQPGEPALTETGQVMGTPAYMAPEQVAGQQITPSTDLYAVGAVMYHALSGQMPFAGDNNYAVMYAIAQGTKPTLASLVRGLDPNLTSVVERAMAVAPQHRFANATQMRHAIEPFAKSSAPAHSLPVGPNAITPAMGQLHSQMAPTPGSPGEAPTLPSPAVPMQSVPYAQSPALSSAPASMPPAPQKAVGTTVMIVALLVVVVALLAIVGVFALVMLRGDDATTVAATAPTAEPSAVAPASTDPATPAPEPPAKTPEEAQPATEPPPPKPEEDAAAEQKGEDDEERSLFDRFGLSDEEDEPDDAEAEKKAAEAQAAKDEAAKAEAAKDQQQQQQQQKKKKKKKKKRIATAGTKPRLVSINAHSNLELSVIKETFATIQTKVTACYVKHEFSPGDHVHSSYHLFIDGNGQTTKVTTMGSRERSPDLDKCLFPYFRKLNFGTPKKPGGGKIDITYTAWLPGN